MSTTDIENGYVGMYIVKSHHIFRTKDETMVKSLGSSYTRCGKLSY